MEQFHRDYIIVQFVDQQTKTGQRIMLVWSSAKVQIVIKELCPHYFSARCSIEFVYEQDFPCEPCQTTSTSRDLVS